MQDDRSLVSCELGNVALISKKRKKKHHDYPTDY